MNTEKLTDNKLHELRDSNRILLKEFDQTFKNMGRYCITTSSEYKAKYMKVFLLDKKLSKEIINRAKISFTKGEGIIVDQFGVEI